MLSKTIHDTTFSRGEESHLQSAGLHPSPCCFILMHSDHHWINKGITRLRRRVSQTSNQATPSQAIPNQKAPTAPPLEGTDITEHK
ncbi:hypothetical protein TNCV_1327071 [Trichonephila clavipes]|nr:hypothetical protein TNCV_1327071 [Trichonephila clavipes]